MLKKVFVIFMLFSLLPLYAKKVKVGYYQNSGNFMSGITKSDPKAGYAYEYIQTAAAYAGWECEYVYGEWDYLYPALLSGEIDILPDVSKLPERESLILYPDYVMGQETYYLYSCDKNTKISPGNYSTWKGKKIAINKDYYYYDLFMEWQKDKKLDCEYIIFSGDDSYYDLFANHEFDLLLEIDMVADSDWNPIERIGASDFYLAVTKSRTDLLEELNEALAEILAMNPYYNNKLWLKYFTETTISKTLTPRELEWISSHPKINVGCMQDDLPFATYNEEEKKAEGLIIEMFAYLSETLLGKKSEFSYVFYDNTDLMFADLKNGILDVVAPMYRDMNFAEQQGFILSEKFAAMAVGYASKTMGNPEEFGKIAIPKRLRMPFYVGKNYPLSNIEYYKNYEECLNAVLKGKCDGAVFNIYKMRGFINKQKKFRNMEVMELSEPCELSFVFSREKRDLFTIVNKMLMIIPPETIITDTNTYVMKEQGYTKKLFFMEYFFFILISIVVFITIFVLLVFALRRIREDMYFDPLTHLRNRRSLNRIISNFLRHALEHSEVFSLILFDLDNFKYLNDTYGHDFGDEVLVATSSLIKNKANKKDRVFRWGGEEFLIIFKGGLAEAKELAETIREAISKCAMKHEYETVHFTATVGVASYNRGMNYMDMFRIVDSNLYKGKNSGKNQVVG